MPPPLRGLHGQGRPPGDLAAPRAATSPARATRPRRTSLLVAQAKDPHLPGKLYASPSETDKRELLTTAEKRSLLFWCCVRLVSPRLGSETRESRRGRRGQWARLDIPDSRLDRQQPSRERSRCREGAVREADISTRASRSHSISCWCFFLSAFFCGCYVRMHRARLPAVTGLTESIDWPFSDVKRGVILHWCHPSAVQMNTMR